MSVDSNGNQKVDFAWGNIPLQPNEDRDGDGAVVVEPANLDQNRSWSGYSVYPSELLNQALDNHLLVSTGHNGYPGYLPGDVDDIPGNIPIPDLEGGTVEFATAQWENAGFNSANITINYIPNAGGATSLNDGRVASQEPTAGHTADVDHVITLNVYQYTVPYLFQYPVSTVFYSGYVGYGNGPLQPPMFIGSLKPPIVPELLTLSDPELIGKTWMFTGTETPLDNEPLLMTSANRSDTMGTTTIFQNLQLSPALTSAINATEFGLINFNSGYIVLIP